MVSARFQLTGHSRPHHRHSERHCDEDCHQSSASSYCSQLDTVHLTRDWRFLVQSEASLSTVCKIQVWTVGRRTPTRPPFSSVTLEMQPTLRRSAVLLYLLRHSSPRSHLPDGSGTRLLGVLDRCEDSAAYWMPTVAAAASSGTSVAGIWFITFLIVDGYTICRRWLVMLRPRASRSSSHRDERWEGCRV